MELNEALRHALDGNAILFLGAGFSLGATNNAGTDFPLASNLAQHLMDALDQSEQVPLQNASELYVKRYGEVGLLDFLNRHLGVKEIARHHQAFARVPWRRVYTTNYDEVFETACRMTGRSVRTAVATLPVGPTGAGVVDCVHLNGYLPWAKVGNLDRTLVLSETAYLTSKLLESPWARLLSDDVRAARSVVFVGYGLGDLDIGRILVERAVKRKGAFVVKPNPGLALRITIEKFGTIAEIGAESAAELCDQLRGSYRPKPAELEFRSFQRVDARASVDAPSTDDLFDLFIRGKTVPGLISRSINDSSSRYIVSRREVNEIVDRLQSGARAITVLGRLANGKTLLADHVCLALPESFDVFRFARAMPLLDAEIDALRNAKRPTVVLFDDYTFHLDVIGRLCLGANENFFLLLTCRTPMHLTHRAQLKQALGELESEEFRIDKLSNPELGSLDSILAGAGLLGEFAKYQGARRIELLRERCGAEMCGILLSLLESTSIQQRLQQSFSSLSGNADVQRVVIAAMAMTHVRMEPDVYDLAELIGARSINQAKFAESEEAADLVHIDGHEMRARSSLFAAAALRALWDRDVVLDVLEDILRSAWRLGRDDKRFDNAARSLMRYSIIKEMVPRQDRAAHVRRYYERIRNLDACANNDLFWLQMTISDITAKDFEQADRHLRQSYALAERKKGYSTYQHDNVKASFLLSREIWEHDSSRAFGSFVEASKIINRQMSDRQHAYYPYRVARLYGDFRRRIAHGWNDDTRGVFLAACTFVLRQVEQAVRDLATMDEVSGCGSEMQDILANARAHPAVPRRRA